MTDETHHDIDDPQPDEQLPPPADSEAGMAEEPEPESEPTGPFIDPDPVIPSPGWLSEPEPEIDATQATPQAVEIGEEPNAGDASITGPAPDSPAPLGGDTLEFAAVVATAASDQPPAMDAEEALEFLTAYDLGAPRELEGMPDERSRSGLWLAVAAAALVAIVASGLALWNATRPVTVPDLVGRGPAEATQILNDFSFRLGSVSETPTETVAPGTVVTQKPAAGEQLSAGERVSIVVAVVPDRAKVPSVVGRTRESAISAAAAARLVPRIVESFSAAVGEGTVVAQLPEAGLELAPGEPVVIVVSRGPAPAQVGVPRLDGLNEAEANQLLAANRLKALYYRSYDASVPAGDIISQSPLARSSSPLGSIVQVLVSQGAGAASVIVPEVTGDTESSATSGLKLAGLKVAVTKTPSSSVAAGRVISQMPSAGRGVGSGATVGLLVSTGPEADISTPDLSGTSAAAAGEAVKAAGLEPVVVPVTRADAPADTVWAQYPAPGEATKRGYPVVMMVSRAAAK